MRYQNVALAAIDYILPSTRLSSADIELQLSSLMKECKIPPGTLEALTGVKERRVWSRSTRPSQLSAEVTKKLIDRTGLNPLDVDVLLYTGVCRDYIEPATAHLVHHHVGLSERCLSMDLSDACLGFLKGMAIGANMIEAGQAETVIVTSAENAQPLYDSTFQRLQKLKTLGAFKESLASFTLGSAAVSCLLRRVPSGQEGVHRISGWVSRLASQFHYLCRGEGHVDDPVMFTDSVGLMKEGVHLAKKTWEVFLEELGWGAEMYQHIITHQVSTTHHQRFFSELGLDIRKGRQESVWLGNTGTVAAPLSLALAQEEQKIFPGDRIAFLGIGSGISSLMMGVEW